MILTNRKRAWQQGAGTGILADIVFGFLEAVIRSFFPRMRVRGFSKNISQPCVFVCNHAMSFGPLAMALRFPAPTCPWVLSPLTERGECARHVENAFLTAELGLKKPLSAILAHAVEGVCVPMMKWLGAVPVYRGSRRLMRTFKISEQLLDKGRNIVIYPEIPGIRITTELEKIDSGFLEILEEEYQDSQKRIPVVPCFIDRNSREIRVGNPIHFNVSARFHDERARIAHEIERELTRLCR